MILELGRSPGEGIGYPLLYSGLENSMDCIVHGVAKGRTGLSDFHFHFFTFSAWHQNRCSIMNGPQKAAKAGMLNDGGRGYTVKSPYSQKQPVAFISKLLQGQRPPVEQRPAAQGRGDWSQANHSRSGS